MEWESGCKDMRPIDADVFEKFIRENCSDSLADLWCELVRRQPTIEAAPVVHGEIITVFEKAIGHQRCSVCGNELEWKAYPNYCNNCGAELKGGAE